MYWPELKKYEQEVGRQIRLTAKREHEYRMKELEKEIELANLSK